ncbi:DegT/DnrJ/EryC1/StrS family aminotransferase [bacterium]|nr:DegT/DnrJ/EryC1/StrS family aminotransferase [bacterium]
MTQSIPILNLKAQYETIQEELESTVLEVLRSGNYILGKYVGTLEKQVAELCGVNDGIGVANGTDALMLALWGLDIGPGDEVITTPFTFAATVEAIVMRGATPVFVDIDPTSYNINPALIEKAITPKTKAIMPVHLYGLPSHMEPICAIAERYGLKVIEDNAQGIGATYKGKPTGSFGDVACTSFYPTKNLGAAGDAGMIVSKDPVVAERIRAIRAHGMRRRYYHDELGVNSRLDELQAATLVVKLPYLKQWNDRRAHLASIYDASLANCPGLIRPSVSLAGGVANGAKNSETGVKHVYHQYTVRVLTSDKISTQDLSALDNPNRDKLIARLTERGIGSMCYYPVPLHVQKAFANLGYKMGDFPISEQLSREVLSLPMYPELTDEQVATVGKTITEIMASEIAVATPVGQVVAQGAGQVAGLAV